GGESDREEQQDHRGYDERRREACAVTRGDTQRDDATDDAQRCRGGHHHEDDGGHPEVAAQFAHWPLRLVPQSTWVGGDFGDAGTILRWEESIGYLDRRTERQCSSISGVIVSLFRRRPL